MLVKSITEISSTYPDVIYTVKVAELVNFTISFRPGSAIQAQFPVPSLDDLTVFYSRKALKMRDLVIPWGQGMDFGTV